MQGISKKHRYSLQACLIICIFSSPALCYAHLITITATKPFGSTVAASSKNTATYTITNIDPKNNVKPINTSKFPANSGLSITSSTCNKALPPKHTCSIELLLNAQTPGKQISSELKFVTEPLVDSVSYPLNINISPSLPNITLVPIQAGKLPALRDPIMASHAGLWLIVSGSLSNPHEFNRRFNTDIYVYNPATSQLYSMKISETNLPEKLQIQLASNNPSFLRDGDTLYIVGGYYTPGNSIFTTINTISAINIPGMINAVIKHDKNLSSFVHINTEIPQFKITGSQLGKIGKYLYLVFGVDCEGIYSEECGKGFIYSSAIHQFATDPNLSSIKIIRQIKHDNLDNSGWRRRDYTLAPLIIDGKETLLAMGGPFTPMIEGEFTTWTNGIVFEENLKFNNNFIEQSANQYAAPHVSMYSANRKTSYVATFGGITALYWGNNGLKQDKFGLPFGNMLDLITVDASGKAQEYANLKPLCSGQPLASCLYMGLGAHFIPVDRYYDHRDILLLDRLPQNAPTIIGYIYGGILTTKQHPMQNAFFTGRHLTEVTNKVYAVVVTPAKSGELSWQNITNITPSPNPHSPSS